MLFTIETQILNLLLAFQCILVNIFTIIAVLDLHFWPLHLLWHSLGALCIWLYLQLLLIGENHALKKYDKLKYWLGQFGFGASLDGANLVRTNMSWANLAGYHTG